MMKNKLLFWIELVLCFEPLTFEICELINDFHSTMWKKKNQKYDTSSKLEKSCTILWAKKNRIDVFVWLRMYCVDKFEQSFKFNWVSIKIVKTSVLQQLILENVWNGFQP